MRMRRGGGRGGRAGAAAGGGGVDEQLEAGGNVICRCLSKCSSHIE